MAEKKTTTAAPKQAPKATQTAMPFTQSRPSGKDFSDSQKFQHHKKEANIAFKKGDIVKSTNHLTAMRHAGKRLQEQAEWARKNPNSDYVKKADRK